LKKNEEFLSVRWKLFDKLKDEENGEKRKNMKTIWREIWRLFEEEKKETQRMFKVRKDYLIIEEGRRKNHEEKMKKNWRKKKKKKITT